MVCLRDKFASVIHENKNAQTIFIVKSYLKNIKLYEPRILEFVFNSFYVRARLALRLQAKQWFYIDFVSGISNIFSKLSYSSRFIILVYFP